MKSEPNAFKYTCIHGHFYQPPRENPWLEDIEREESARPFHDWNERIAEECYKPNAAARILDDEGRIIEMLNNYRHMSFNYGPTLLRWMQKHSRTAYEAILEADRLSHEETRGHGNAIAQVYNHVILPLANERDKRTQIRWGARDFEHRFGRKPEGMWLAETAVDDATLAALADEGIQFTILSPYQAKKWRFLDGSAWQDCDVGDIPTGRTYIWQRKDGRPIHLFFYDGAIAKGIAFERMLGDAGHLVGAIEHAHAQRRGARPGEPWLVHTATDGESYGHHFAHGDMALAAAHARLQRDPLARLTNYGTFLASTPVRAEVAIKDVSAWSCAHGVGRWSRDCGCRIGGGPEWNQKWRGPLREALDVVRDALALHYEKEMASIVKDPWATRDAYIDVILEPMRATTFASEQARRTLDDEGRVKFYRLLEMQRAALLMYTSCGWFFDDVSGGESIILMKYAARALELARITGGDEALERRFTEVLARAESNIPSPDGDKMTGRELYFQRAKSVAVTHDAVVASYALRALSTGAQRSTHLYAYRVTHHEEVPLTKGAVPCLVGHVDVEDERTLEKSANVYALAHFGGLDFRCAVRPWTSQADTAAVVERMRAAVVDGSTTDMMVGLDDAFGPRALTLEDTFLDLRQDAARRIGREKVALLTAVGAELLDNHRALLQALKELGVALPPHVETLASHVLSQKADELLVELVDAVATDNNPAGHADIEFASRAVSSRLRSIADEAASLGLKLSIGPGAAAVGEALVEHLSVFGETRDPDKAAAALRLLDACAQLQIQPRLWDVQTEWHRLARYASSNTAVRDALRRHPQLALALDAFGRTRFGEGLAGS